VVSDIVELSFILRGEQPLMNLVNSLFQFRVGLIVFPGHIPVDTKYINWILTTLNEHQAEYNTLYKKFQDIFCSIGSYI